MNSDNSSVAYHSIETETVKREATDDGQYDGEASTEARAIDVSGRDVPRSVRICAVLLIAGGVIGVAQGAFGVLVAYGGMSAIVQIVIFGICGIVGLALWKGSPWALPWSLVLFALQIPVIATAPVAYEAFTGATLAIYAGGGSLGFEYGLGSGFVIFLNSQRAAPSFFGPDKPLPSIGLNLVALVCFIMLVRYRSMRRKESS